MSSFIKSAYSRKRLISLALVVFVLASLTLLPGIFANRHTPTVYAENIEETLIESKENPASFISKQKNSQAQTRPFVSAAGGEAFILENNMMGVRTVSLKTTLPVFKAFGLSSDSQKLLYTSLKNGVPSGELYLEDLRTGQAVKVTSRLVLSAALSPTDDNLVAYTFSRGETFGLAITELDSERSRVLVPENVFTEIIQWDDSGKGIHYFEAAIEASTLALNARYVSVDSVISDEIFLPVVPAGFPKLSRNNNDALNIQKFLKDNPADNDYAFQTFAPDGRHEVFGSNLLGKTRLFARHTASGKTIALGEGQLLKVLQTGVIIKEFLSEGTKLQFVDWKGKETYLGITIVKHNLPIANSYMIQGGSGYSAPGNCNIIAHTGALEFAYDFQSLTVSEHAMASADGLVVLNVSSVTCNTIDTDSCPDYSAGGCPGSYLGNVVVIQHANGTYSKYTHMETNSPQAVVGTNVNQGLYIGRQGHTGSTNGTFNGCGDHLHFQLQSSPDIFGQSVAIDFADVTTEPLACATNYISGSTEISHSISPNSQNFGITGGNDSVNVTSTGGTWSATSNDSWITITSAENGNGNDVVTYDVADNSAGSPRTGTMNIGGHLFTVSQNGVQPPNQAPTANAGVDQTITLPNSANLSGTATDDGLPTPANLTTDWSQVSGPGTVSFGNPNSLNTTASFSLAGIYVLRLTANDGALTATDDLTVIVNTNNVGGLLSGSQTPPSTNTNLSTEGTSDWAHWGLNTATDFNHKNGVTQQISNYTQIGVTSPLRYTNNPNFYSWTDGTPTASANNTTTGVYLYEIGNGFQITVPADTTQRILKIYVGLWAAGGRLEASLSDGSASPYIDTSLISTDVQNGVYTLNYKAASSGQTLTIKWTVNSNTNALGNVTLQAASLADFVPPPNQAPTANAGSDQTITLPSDASLVGTASDDGLPTPANLTTTWSKVSGPGTVTFGNVNSLNTTAGFSINGNYVLRLTANDGALSTTDDVSITVNNPTPGGLLSATSNSTPTNTNLTTEGTSDWAHWGLTSPSSFNHKNGVSSQISNYTQLGGGTIQHYANNPSFYSWTDGTPTASSTNTPTGVYVIGFNRGFQVTVPADTTQRTLKMYVGLWAAGGRFEASLSDASATTYVDTSLVNSSGTSNRVYTLNYQAASAGQTLTIKWTVNQTFNAWSNVTLQAATLVLSGPPPTNQAPVVNAGADQNLTTTSTSLNGTATDDGLPIPANLTTTWSEVSGPGTVNFGNVNSLNTTVSFNVQGTYVLRLTANDGALSATDDVIITVNNQAPTANAGSDQTITLPNSANLSGTATDDGLPNPPSTLTTTWSKVSGPGTVSFGNTNSLSTTASFSLAGVYTLRLTSNDSLLTTTDDVVITVNNAGAGGSLSVGNTTTPTSTNLTTEGTSDWAHWGLTTQTSFNHKSGVTQQISNFTALGIGTIQRYANNPNFYSWTGGTPTASSTNTPTGVYVIGQNNGFQITVPADTTQRTLKMYVGLWAAGGRFEASLSDASATTYVDTSLVNSSGTSNRVYTLNYQAASAGQTLTIKWTVNQTFNAWSNVTLQAATLADGGGTPPNPSGEFQISSSVNSAQYSSHIATDPNGNFVVVWQSNGQDGDSWGIYARRYNAAGVPQGNEFQVNTYTTNNQFVPRVAMDSSGNFAIVWESNGQDGNSYGIYCKRYNAAGVPLGNEFQVNTTIANSQHDPFIAMTPAGNFVVVWVSDLQDGSLAGIYGQRFDAAGNPQGSEFQVNTYTTNDQRQPAVSIDANGNFAVVYESVGQDGDGKGVYVRRYDAAGVPQGNEFKANTYTTNDQSDSWINMNLNGDFMVVWGSTGQDGSGIGIYAQRYNAAGAAQGGEFRVNTYTTNDQVYPSVAIENNGDFVVVWESVGQDGSGRGIFGQRYVANGTAQGSEFQVNTYTANDQFIGLVAKYPTGNFIVVWTSFGQDGSGEGVYGQRYTSSGSLQGENLFMNLPIDNSLNPNANRDNLFSAIY